MTWATAADQACRAAGLRQGAARSAVIAVLADSDGGLTAAEVAARARSDRGPVSHASTYRILTELVEFGVLRAVDLGTGQSHHELVHPDGHHQHHLVCDDCGRTDRFADSKLEATIHELEARLDFEASAHDVVLHGRCTDCRS